MEAYSDLHQLANFISKVLSRQQNNTHKAAATAAIHTSDHEP
jgi:hypothetical protein